MCEEFGSLNKESLKFQKDFKKQSNDRLYDLYHIITKNIN